jgi:hypothetical protein
VGLSVAARIPVARFLGDVAAGDEGVWVAILPADGDGGELARIDPATNTVAARTELEGVPEDILAAEGSVWVSLWRDGPSLLQVDPRTVTVVREIPGVGGFLAEASGRIWTTRGPRELLGIDPSSGRIVASVEVAGGDGWIAGPLRGTPDAVWLVVLAPSPSGDPAEARLVGVDGGTGQVRQEVLLPPGSGAIAVADGDGVWTASWSGDASHLTRTDAVTGRAGPEVSVPGAWGPFAAEGGRLWLMGRGPGGEGPYEVAALDTSALELRARLPIGELPAHEGGGVFDAVTGSLWIAGAAGSVTRVEVG